jgi:hypothetical protein
MIPWGPITHWPIVIPEERSRGFHLLDIVQATTVATYPRIEFWLIVLRVLKD